MGIGARVRRAASVWAITAGSLAGCGDAVEDAVEETATPIDTLEQEPPPPVQTGVRGFPTPRDSSRPAGTLGDVTEGSTVIATLEEWRIELSDDTLPVGQVTIAVENRGTMPHALEIVSEVGGRWRSAPVAPGGSIRMSMLLSNATHRIYCPLEDDAGDHSERGMQATLVVR